MQSKSITGERIEHLVAQFLATTLPKEQWTHEAHIIVGVWHIHRYGFEEALPRMRQAIIRYNEAVGTVNTDTTGYHETLTVVWLRLIDTVLQASKRECGAKEQASLRLSSDTVAFWVHNFLHHQLADRSTPLNFYSRERLFSSAARKEFLEPDLRALPE